jgi:hypothetical protein
MHATALPPNNTHALRRQYRPTGMAATTRPRAQPTTPWPTTCSRPTRPGSSWRLSFACDSGLTRPMAGGSPARRRRIECIAAAVCCSGGAAGRWQPLLEQDQMLRVLRGSVAAAAAAVQRGADLRLYMVTDTYGTSYEEVMNFKQSLWRRTPPSEDDRFSGMGLFLSSVHHGRDITAPYLSFFNYDTCRGALEGPTHSLMKITPGGDTLDESNYEPTEPANYSIYRWFVRDRYRIVYEHDADGAQLSGNKEELKACIRTGQTVRVGIWGLSGLEEVESSNSREEISFLETAQPFIPVLSEDTESFFGQQGHASEVNLACDPVMVPAASATWPLSFREGLTIASLVPCTSGRIVAFLTQPSGAFRREVRKRAMRWVVADD